ncbi:dsDNA nuclease domain-containing protein [Desulforamulus aeronauticus]|uniref:CD-NTase associated protein 4-like DNA endonuclease domain-containing protein n=1 Tax=Desulforamulus aeronauticus DSM 10349 TaxID=1121421 RepID=A0A1M6UYC9_9FIRM|nr:dsDNA nuclease domain-containing protein [Desulforamulus aeronauticus]SHK74218.1 hypothetical protein SAMN02745123_02983 [Desulforamulus aeronauticus DSM 10349]
MGYFGRQQSGGSIERKGLVYQDCVAVIYLFRNLSNSKFTSISFETMDDFVIHYAQDQPDLHVQVKINQLDVNRIRSLLNTAPEKEDMVQCYVGSSMNDDLRNLRDKLQQLSDIGDESERVQAELELEEICAKKKLEFVQLKKVKLDTIGEQDAAKLAWAEVLEWAEKRKLFVDAKRILSELIECIHLDLSVRRRGLSRGELIEIINRNRTSKIVSGIDNVSVSLLKQRFLQDIEADMLIHTRDFSELQVIKLLVERNQLPEYKNSIEMLYLQNPSYLELQLWSLLFLEEFEEIERLCSEHPTDGNSSLLILALAHFANEKYMEALSILDGYPEKAMRFEEAMVAGMCYANLGDKKHAQARFEHCVELQPRSALPCLMQANLHPYSKTALDLVERAICLEPECAEAYLQKGALCRYFGENALAVSSYERYMELSKEYGSLFVLQELAFACYNATGETHEKYPLYFARWFSELISQGKIIKKDGEELTIGFVDIGYKSTNFAVLNLDKDGAAIFWINGVDRFKIPTNRAFRGAVGLSCPPNNLDLMAINYLNHQLINETCIHLSLEERLRLLSGADWQRIQEKAAVPTLFRITESNEDYQYLKQSLIAQNVLHINHDWEYYVDECDIDVSLHISMHTLNAKVRVGKYTMNIFVPNAGAGLQSFQRKLSEGPAFQEAAILLKGPSEFTQITFRAEWIKRIYT